MGMMILKKKWNWIFFRLIDYLDPIYAYNHEILET